MKLLHDIMSLVSWALVVWFAFLIGQAIGAPDTRKLFNVSAYCPGACCCGEFADGRTANNYKIQPGDHFVAAPKKYPFGTKMVIPGYNNGRPVEVKDRGGAIKGNKIDLFFGDKDGVSGHQRALNWGRQHLYVEIVQ